jgi:hypothetical protein
MRWKNFLTTISGIVAGLPPIINAIVPIVAPKTAAIISAIGMVLTGLFAKDYNKTGV